MYAPFDDDPLARYRLRILRGPLVGALIPLHDHFCIGRASVADLQLLDDRTSRRHAQVVQGEDSAPWLVDLGSSNGTFVDDQRIDRAPLAAGRTCRIGNTTFLLEPQLSTDRGAPTLVVSYHGAPSRCGTAAYSMAESLRSAGPRHGPREAGAHDVVATRPDGTRYPGNVVEDIAHYHALRLRTARAQPCSPRQLEHLDTLASALGLTPRPGDGPDMPRLHTRFSCVAPATLRLRSGESLSVTTVDLGVDGAQLTVHDHRLERGYLAWLAIALLTGHRLRTVVFAARVEWNCGNHVGLSFASKRAWREKAEPWHDTSAASVHVPSLRPVGPGYGLPAAS